MSMDKDTRIKLALGVGTALGLLTTMYYRTKRDKAQADADKANQDLSIILQRYLDCEREKSGQ
jgi:hypothetical protein